MQCIYKADKERFEAIVAKGCDKQLKECIEKAKEDAKGNANPKAPNSNMNNANNNPQDNNANANNNPN